MPGRVPCACGAVASYLVPENDWMESHASRANYGDLSLRCDELVTHIQTRDRGTEIVRGTRAAMKLVGLRSCAEQAADAPKLEWLIEVLRHYKNNGHGTTCA